MAGIEPERRDNMAWDLDKLRALRDQGDLTIAEYETLRRKAIDQIASGTSGGAKAESAES